MSDKTTLPHITIVDDDTMVGTMTAHCVKRAGYTTTVFNTPLEALNWFSDHPHETSLVISDHNMPEMTGAELARALADTCPHIPVIICSGYIDAIEEYAGDLPNISAIMTKPTPTNDLLSAVERALRTPIS